MCVCVCVREGEDVMARCATIKEKGDEEVKGGFFLDECIGTDRSSREVKKGTSQREGEVRTTIKVNL